jgi:hypothetical protein
MIRAFFVLFIGGGVVALISLLAPALSLVLSPSPALAQFESDPPGEQRAEVSAPDVPGEPEFERKLGGKGFCKPLGVVYDGPNLVAVDFAWTAHGIPFQEVCDLLGCKLEDFREPMQRGFTYEGMEWMSHSNALFLGRRDYSCKVWILDSGNQGTSDLSAARVRVAIELHPVAINHGNTGQESPD